MKIKVFCVFWLCLSAFECSQIKQDEREYFVKQCSFVCDYPFDEISKYAVTCRVWGLLKYYHPNVTAGKLDWDNVLLDCLDSIESESSPVNVNSAIRNMIQTAEKYKISKQDFHDSLNMNVNLCWIDNSFLDKDIRLELHKISSNTVVQPSYYGTEIGNDNFLRFKNDKNYEINSYKYRLLALFRYWNVIYYFSPYKYMMDKSWDTVLSESVLKFISADDISLYHKAIIDMAVATNDGHAATNLISYPTDLTEYFTLVDSNTVVRISPEQSSLERGDIILKVGNKEIWNIRDSIAVTISSSNIHYTNYRVDRQLYDVIRYASDITILRKNIKLTVPIKFAPAYLQKNKRDMEISSSFKKISNETGYVNLDRLKDSEVSNMFDSMKNTKGIILDLRNYPRHSSFYDIICYLSSKQQHEYLQFTLPDTLHPGAFYWRHYAMSYSDEQIVNSSKYVGKIVVLIFENTMSSAETTAVMYRTAGNAILIGRPTAGANGNAAKLLLPNKVSVFFSGYGAYYPDRTEIQRKGVIPDIEVYPDMQSIMAGKDEILEAAISYIENL